MPLSASARTYLVDFSTFVLTVTLSASALFLLFGVVYLYEAFLAIDPEAADLHPLIES